MYDVETDHPHIYELFSAPCLSVEVAVFDSCSFVKGLFPTGERHLRFDTRAFTIQGDGYDRQTFRFELLCELGKLLFVDEEGTGGIGSKSAGAFFSCQAGMCAPSSTSSAI